MIELESLSVAQLLRLHSGILDELRQRRILRTANNPRGDYAEWRVAQVLRSTLATKNSAPGFDATDDDGLGCQIEARHLTSEHDSTQLSVIRNLNERDFDVLVAIVLAPDWRVRRAIMLPHAAVESFASNDPMRMVKCSACAIRCSLIRGSRI